VAIPAFSSQKQKTKDRKQIKKSQCMFAMRAKRPPRHFFPLFQPINCAIQKAANADSKDKNKKINQEIYEHIKILITFYSLF